MISIKMTENLEIRSIESAHATEIYLSATPTKEASLQEQAPKIFSGIRDVLLSKKACILEERIFSTPQAVETLREARSQSYGDLDDGVAPSILIATEGLSGPLAGVQVHAVSSESKPEVIDLDGIRCGRILRMPGRAYLTLSCISDPQPDGATVQARAMMEKAESALEKVGANFLSVPRTWMWLKDILSWYDDFNHVRTTFFTERGLIGEGTRQSMPASTGIGLGPANGAHCGMDLIAVLEPTHCTEYLQITGKQHSALDYGSAFSRAARSVMPAGQAVFVSGTASIDAEGATTHVGDAQGQIDATIDNVLAVLNEMQCSEKDIVQVIAYCKTIEVEKIFNASKNRLDWPWLTVICDICRDDLLFEIEATAMPR
jgi:enamine deaminase RidA (YjgF/YER057c/UK114 family)